MEIIYVTLKIYKGVSHRSIDTLTIHMKQSNSLTSFDWLLIGFIFHALGGIFFNTSKIVCYILCGLGLIIIAISIFLSIPNKFPFKGSIQLLFYLFIFWSFLILMRPFLLGETFNMDGFSLINKYTWLSFLIPLIVFIDIDHLPIKKIFKFIYIYGIIGLILLTIYYQDIFSVNQNLDSEDYQTYIGLAGIPLEFLFVSAFSVLCYAFVPIRYRIIAFFSMFISLFVVLYTARRGSVFMFVLIFIFAFYLYAFASKKGSLLLKLFIITTIIVCAALIFNSYADSTFSFFITRLDEDSRTGVIEYFMKSFKGKTLDWIIGRGINGIYYCPNFDQPYRGSIEAGYLHLILKGGIIYLMLYIFLLIQAAFLGFFRTNNLLTKAMAFYLLYHVIYLVPFGLPAFNFEYVIVWISFLYCQSTEWRMYANEEIIKQLSIN